MCWSDGQGQITVSSYPHSVDSGTNIIETSYIHHRALNNQKCWRTFHVHTVMLDHTHYRNWHRLAGTKVGLKVRLMARPHKRKQENVGLLPGRSTLGLTGMLPSQIQLLEKQYCLSLSPRLGKWGHSTALRAGVFKSKHQCCSYLSFHCVSPFLKPMWRLGAWKNRRGAYTEWDDEGYLKTMLGLSVNNCARCFVFLLLSCLLWSLLESSTWIILIPGPC